MSAEPCAAAQPQRNDQSSGRCKIGTNIVYEAGDLDTRSGIGLHCSRRMRTNYFEMSVGSCSGNGRPDLAQEEQHCIRIGVGRQQTKIDQRATVCGGIRGTRLIVLDIRRIRNDSGAQCWQV